MRQERAVPVSSTIGGGGVLFYPVVECLAPRLIIEELKESLVLAGGA